MHRRHCQPVEINIERVAALPTKRLMWSREDDKALRRHSDHLWKTGMLKKELYTLLLPHFPGRLQEAVKRLQTINCLSPPIVFYLRHLYERSTIKLAGTTTTCGWGIQQGDPLSPLLFIIVVEDTVTASLPSVGYDLDDHRISSIAYADNLVLFAEKSPRFQEKLHLLSEALTRVNMALNAKKSLGLTIARDGKSRCVALLPITYTCEGSTINPLGPGDSFCYLGLQFN
ncbi:hypothetical protein E2320_017105 [Naja naja]|nr:hypothetical protein E2320_017105 [Naja naja]